MNIESYSEELEYVSRVCHQLHINIMHIQSELQNFEEYGTFHTDICEVQVKYIIDLQVLSGKRFVDLIKQEPAYEGLVVHERLPLWKKSDLDSEIQSEDLRYVIKVCRKLDLINVILKSQLQDIGNGVVDVDALNEKLRNLSDLLGISGKRFIKLMRKESSISCVVYDDNYPFVSERPDWIGGLFPYCRPNEEVAKILRSGGSVVNFDEVDGVPFLNEIVIEAHVPDSFVVVWYPISAHLASPGFVWKSGRNNWLAHGLEL